MVQITFAFFSFRGSIISVFTPPKEYSTIVGGTLASTSVEIDAIPHFFSRTVTIAFAILCIVGFILIIFRRKLRKIDLSIFLTGVLYSGLGLALSVLGLRAVPLIFVSISMGIPILFQSKFKKYIKYLLVVLLVFFVFVPIHSSFTSYPLTFQTREDLATANFMINKYDWNSKSTVIADLGTAWYTVSQIYGNTEIDSDTGPRFGLSNIIAYDSIVYSLGLAESLNNSGISVEATSQRIMDRFDIVYNSGFSYIATKSG
jgi:hypothetical protein